MSGDGAAQHPVPRSAVGDPRLTRPDWITPPERDPDLLWLDKNENGDPEMVDLVASLLGRLDPRIVSTYPELTRLYHLLAGHVGVEPSMVVVTGGADGGIRSVFEAFVSPGDAVLRFEPTYAMFDVYGHIYGARQTVVDYQASADGPVLDLDVLRSKLASVTPRLVCLPNPASPTGTVLDLETLASIAELVADHGGVLLVDEAYHPFHPVTAVPLLRDHPNVIVVRTFSKAWALSGLRIGYCVAAQETTRLLHKVRPGYETNFVAVRMAEALLAEEAAMWQSVERLNEGRDWFLGEMSALGLRTAPSGGNFLLVDFADHALAVHSALEDLVLYRRNFGHPSLAGFSRFSATTAVRFAPVAARVRAVVEAGQ